MFSRQRTVHGKFRIQCSCNLRVFGETILSVDLCLACYYHVNSHFVQFQPQPNNIQVCGALFKIKIFDEFCLK